MSELYDRERSAREELRRWAILNPEDNDPGDVISEIAESTVPVYTYNILQCACDNLWLATTEPEFDAPKTAAEIITINLYTHFEEELYQEWERIQEEKEAIQFDVLYAEIRPNTESLGTSYTYNRSDNPYWTLDCFDVEEGFTNYWDAFKRACEIAQAFEADSLEFGWKISEYDVDAAAKKRTEKKESESNTLIWKQQRRNKQVIP